MENLSVPFKNIQVISCRSDIDTRKFADFDGDNPGIFAHGIINGLPVAAGIRGCRGCICLSKNEKSAFQETDQRKKSAEDYRYLNPERQFGKLPYPVTAGGIDIILKIRRIRDNVAVRILIYDGFGFFGRRVSGRRNRDRRRNCEDKKHSE